jgi:hypothetical protein
MRFDLNEVRFDSIRIPAARPRPLLRLGAAAAPPPLRPRLDVTALPRCAPRAPAPRAILPSPSSAAPASISASMSSRETSAHGCTSWRVTSVAMMTIRTRSTRTRTTIKDKKKKKKRKEKKKKRKIKTRRRRRRRRRTTTTRGARATCSAPLFLARVPLFAPSLRATGPTSGSIEPGAVRMLYHHII